MRGGIVAIVAGMLAWSSMGGALLRAEPASPDLRHFWRFDQDKPGEPPNGFAAGTAGGQQAGTWKVEADPEAPSPPNRLAQEAACPTVPGAEQPSCLQVLLVSGMTYEYPDLTVRLKQAAESPHGGAGGGGIVFGAKDARNFYAAIVDLAADVLEVVRVTEGQVSLIGRQPAKRKPVAWHTLRVQHNTILSKDFVEVSFDGRIVFTHWDKKLGGGQIGMVTRGDAAVWFDNFDAVQLFSQRPLSPPAAY